MEITQGIWNVLKGLIKGSSLTLALIYTCGHILIAMTVVTVMTGASLWEAGAVALVEPYQWRLVLCATSYMEVVQ